MRSVLTFDADTTKTFAANPRRGSSYQATVQNLTDQMITITVTNQDIQEPSPTYSATPTATTIAVGAMGLILEPYQGWLITCAAADGTVEITEAG